MPPPRSPLLRGLPLPWVRDSPTKETANRVYLRLGPGVLGVHRGPRVRVPRGDCAATGLHAKASQQYAAFTGIPKTQITGSPPPHQETVTGHAWTRTCTPASSWAAPNQPPRQFVSRRLQASGSLALDLPRRSGRQGEQVRPHSRRYADVRGRMTSARSITRGGHAPLATHASIATCAVGVLATTRPGAARLKKRESEDSEPARSHMQPCTRDPDSIPPV